jgi:hypothetical protein
MTRAKTTAPAPSEEVDLLRRERETRARKPVHSANSDDREGPSATALRLLYEQVCSRGAEVVRVPPGLVDAHSVTLQPPAATCVDPENGGASHIR